MSSAGRKALQLKSKVLFILFLFNALNNLICFILQVQDHKGNIISCQTSPLFSQEAVMEQSVYKVSFVVDIPALGLTTYTVSHVTPDRSFEYVTMCDHFLISMALCAFLYLFC